MILQIFRIILASTATGVYCGNVKCSAYEKCALDKSTKRQKCVRTWAQFEIMPISNRNIPDDERKQNLYGLRNSSRSSEKGGQTMLLISNVIVLRFISFFSQIKIKRINYSIRHLEWKHRKQPIAEHPVFAEWTVHWI